MTALSTVTLVALSSHSKRDISTLLNTRLTLPSSNGYCRDWRGLTQVFPVEISILHALYFDNDPADQILKNIQKVSPDFSLKDLLDLFEEIERFDVIDEIKKCLEKDADTHIKRLERSSIRANEIDCPLDKNLLTLDDILRAERGLGTQYYDAFLMHAESDSDFAEKIIDQLENKNNLKLCLKDRDLVAGIDFEHKAIMDLITERCNRLILLLTPDFFKSPANTFLVNFTQADAVNFNKTRKIIPVIYKDCDIPNQLQYIIKKHYNASKPHEFWDGLVKSVKTFHFISRGVVVQKNEEAMSVASLDCVKSMDSDENIRKISNSSQSCKPMDIENEQPKPGNRTSFKDKESPHELSTSKRSDSQLLFKTSESVPELPSLEGLDSLFCVDENKKQKFMATSKCSESVPQLPSLEGLDSLLCIEENKKQKFMATSNDVESIPQLPSLGHLDSFSSTITVQKKKKSKFVRHYVKKVHSLIAKN